MNAGQQRYANADPLLGNLLIQIDTFYQALPQAVRDSYDRMGVAPVAHGCHVDIGPEETPDSCVMDCGDIDDCVCAGPLVAAGKTKFACEHWKPISFTLKL